MTTATTPNKRIVGMVHLGPLPGSPRFRDDLDSVIERAQSDARALADGGIDAVMIENFFDAPFAKGGVPPVTIAAMTRAVLAVRQVVAVPVGVNVLRNDACAALSIAHVCGAQFVRCNVFVGAAVTDQGVIEGAAREVVLLRKQLNAAVEIWADVGVKHAAQLGDTPLAQQALDATERGLADALIVTGSGTGVETPASRVAEARQACPAVPLYVGSGLTAHNATALLKLADGAVVGSSLKLNGNISAPVDVARVRELIESVRAAFPE